MNLLQNGLSKTVGGYRAELSVKEHSDTLLPLDIIKSDGSLDLYEDVQKKFQIEYKRKKKSFVIRAGGWLGYVPINDKYALRIVPRVPISNIERIIDRSYVSAVERIDKYSRFYSKSSLRPKALFDLLIDGFMSSLDAIWHGGLNKNYVSKRNISSSPHGRIDPVRSAEIQFRTGTTVAAYDSFVRTPNTFPNRVIKSAVKTAIKALSLHKDLEYLGKRRRLASALRHLAEIDDATSEDIHQLRRGESLARLFVYGPYSYQNAIRLAALILDGGGISTRGGEKKVELPVVLVNMAEVFEAYSRIVTQNQLESATRFTVLDGNKGGASGAKRNLFESPAATIKNPSVTPDIVVSLSGRPVVVLDVKYKEAGAVPERSEINQIICYAERYACKKAMILYPEAWEHDRLVRFIGLIGGIEVYAGAINLGAADLDAEERKFGQQLAAACRT